MLTEIKNKLEELDPNVFYGMVDKTVITSDWNYIVFGRRPSSVSPNKTGFTQRYWVGVSREDYVPEGFEYEVIDKLSEIDGLKFSGSDIQFDYLMKPNTNTVVEVLVIEFIKAKKRAV